MPDINSPWGGDWGVSPNGDLALVDGDARAKQRIIRRFFTNLGAYIFHPDYGASVPERIGDNLDVNVIASVLTGQALLEDAVAKSPPPVVTCVAITNGVLVRLVYTAVADGLQKSLTLDYPPTSGT